MSKQFVAILCGICFVAGAAAGVYWLAPALTQHHYTEKIIERTNEVKVPVVVEGKETHTVSYVDRPVLIDAKTGQPVQDAADIVAANGTKSSLQVALIGPSGMRKEITFDKGENERWIFDTNQLRMENDINLTGTFDVTDLFNSYALLKESKAREEARKQYLKHFSISGGYLPGAGSHVGLGWSPNGSLEYEIKKPLERNGFGGEMRLRF